MALGRQKVVSEAVPQVPSPIGPPRRRLGEGVALPSTRVRALRWDRSFFTNKNEYIQQRLRFQQELEQLTPIPDDDLEQAANPLGEFRSFPLPSV